MHPPLAGAGTLGARALACKRGRRLLFRGLDLQLAPGSITWLRGRNGSGKTSLLRILAGLSAPSEGDITWNGAPIGQAGVSAREAIVYIGHANALKDDLTATESLHFLSRLHGFECAAPALADALRRFGLHSRRDAPVRTLSQGQRRRVALARLCLAPADAMWLLDEPFDALDAEGVQALNALLAEHAARGGSVLLTSHVPLTLSSPAPISLQLGEVAPT